jgi:3-hydroxyacyl-[acyl-carrier-protein] dehydratase
MSEGETGKRGIYSIPRILEALPHRYPLLLVDRVAELVPGERIRAIKAVSFNEQFFQGHFPGRPIMPGVLQVEALAQAAGILAVETGCLLELEASFVQQRSRVCKFAGKASVEGKVTCEVKFTAMIADG